MKMSRTKFRKWCDAGAELGRKDAAEVFEAISKYGADRAHNGQSARMVSRIDKMKAAGMDEYLIKAWHDAHAEVFNAVLHDLSSWAPKTVWNSLNTANILS